MNEWMDGNAEAMELSGLALAPVGKSNNHWEGAALLTVLVLHASRVFVEWSVRF